MIFTNDHIIIIILRVHKYVLQNTVSMVQDPVKVGVANLAERFLKTTASWTTIYLWGYFCLSPGWLLGPLIPSVLR